MDKSELCEICNIRPLKPKTSGGAAQKYCLPCSKIVRYEKNRLAYQEKKKLKKPEIFECVYCKKVFVKEHGQQKQCFLKKCLEEEKAKKEQSRWLNQKERPKPRNSFSCFSYIS